jgi:hypothetical protein
MLAAFAGLVGVASAQTPAVDPPVIITEGVKGNTIILVLVNDASVAVETLPTTHAVNWREVPAMFMGNITNPRNPENRYIVNPMVYRQGNPYYPYYQVQAELLPQPPAAVTPKG